MNKKPNFLLFITDQHRATDLECAGHPVLKTRNIDRIAERGRRFNRFYVATPVCMPNRASLMTGRMPSAHGGRHNGIPLSRDAVTFVDLLRAAGYDTALIGKSHLQTQSGRPPISKFAVKQGYTPPPKALNEARRSTYRDGSYDQELPDRWKEPDAKIDTPFYGFDHVELLKGHGDQLSGTYLQWFRERHPAPLSLMGPENQLPGNTYTVPQAWRTAVPEELSSSAFVADRITAYLRDRCGDQPFFLMASFPDPHHPFTPPGRYWDMYKPEDMPRPAVFERNDWAPPPHVQAWIEAHRRGEKPMDLTTAHGVDLKEALEARALTCGSIACIDDAVGKIMQALEASGDAENTIVIFTSDHGEYLGDHGLLLKGLAHYDEIIRVPFIWADPSYSGGETSQALTSTIDLPATILDRAGLAPFNGFQGRSLMPVICGLSEQHRSEVVIEDENQRTLPGLGRTPRERTLVTDRYRLSVFQDQDWGELYYLEEDPHELRNLWDDTELDGVKADLTSRLLHRLIEIDDRSPMPLHQS
jgi:arylsulfatase A-like enzyme